MARTWGGDSSHKSLLEMLFGAGAFMDGHSLDCRRIGTEDFEERRLAGEIGKRAGHALVLLVPFDVDEEQVLPEAGLGRPRGTRFDSRHAYAVGRERRKERVDGPRLVFRRHDKRGPVP